VAGVEPPRALAPVADGRFAGSGALPAVVIFRRCERHAALPLWVLSANERKETQIGCHPERSEGFFLVPMAAWERENGGPSLDRVGCRLWRHPPLECGGSQAPPGFECLPVFGWSRRMTSRHKPDAALASRRPEPKRRRHGARRTQPHPLPGQRRPLVHALRVPSGTPLCWRTPKGGRPLISSAFSAVQYRQPVAFHRG